MIKNIFALSNDVRYVAIYRDGHLETKSKEDTIDASSSDSDRYEELLVNPTLITLSTQRGNIDCGGLDYLIIRYGNFFQFVLPATWGHVSVCIEKNADPVTIGLKVKSLINEY
ncbi:MAG: hypothetical protein V3T59_05050 [Desulfobacterales bacterium]